MDVFISWSGRSSQILAEAIRDFLKRTIQAIRPFMSSEDIRKGQRWPTEIGDRLGKAQYCILCLTAANLKSPWLLYEAGAISRERTAGVSAVLLDIEPSEVEWPLAQFQHTKPIREDISKLLRDLNERLPEKLEDSVLSDVLAQYWPDLEKKIEMARSAGKDSKPPPAKSPQEKMIEELLSTSRENARLLAVLVEARQPLTNDHNNLRYWVPPNDEGMSKELKESTAAGWLFKYLVGKENDEAAHVVLQALEERQRKKASVNKKQK